MKFESISDNITMVWPDEDKFELHKSLLFSTISRSLKDVKGRKEFYEQKGLTTKADSFMTENLGFGDKSISEMFNLNIEFHKVPMVFSMRFLDFEHVSPQESSSRYLRIPKDYFDKFEHMSHVEGYDNYLENCKLAIGIYNRVFDEVYDYYQSKFPVESIDWSQNMSDSDIIGTYNSTIKSKTADAVKIFLPSSTFTNFDICINARGLQDILGEMSYDNAMDDGMFTPYLTPLINYLQKDEKTRALFTKLPDTINIWSQKAINNHLNPHLNINANVHKTTDFVTSYYLTPQVEIPINRVPRKNRHDRLHFTYRFNEFMFLITSSIAAFRDMNRHRKVYKAINNIHLPNAIIANRDMMTDFMDYLVEYRETNVLDKVKSLPLFRAGLPLGTAIDWIMQCNLYELSNIVELRSGKGGYWEYIRLARELAECVGMQYNLFEHGDFTTNYDTSLPTLRQEQKKVSSLQNSSN